MVQSQPQQACRAPALQWQSTAGRLMTLLQHHQRSVRLQHKYERVSSNTLHTTNLRLTCESKVTIPNYNGACPLRRHSRHSQTYDTGT